MHTEEQKEIIRKIAELQKAVEDRFNGQYPEIFKDLYTQVLTLTSQVNLSGSAETRAKELIQLQRLKKKIAEVVYTNKAYQVAVKEVTDSYKEISKLSDDYFRTVIDGYKPKQELYKAVLESNIQFTRDALLGNGIQETFARDITGLLKNSLIKKSSQKPFNEALKHLIEGYRDQPPILQNQLKTAVADSIMISNRQYLEVISEDLNISYYIYSGTIISDTRPFCAARAGKIFKKSEIESWAKLSWSGKMPGTTKETIFVLCAGYRCRHSFFPATKAQFTLQEKRKENQ